MKWLLYAAILILGMGCIAAFRIQFSRNIHRKDVIAAVVLLATGAICLSFGVALAPS